MRIIAGEFRGRTLKAPKGEGTRPTTDRVREAMMSTVHSARGGFDDAVVLDAFAGSGALGLEALSRGASSCVFLDESRAACTVVRENAAAARLAERARVLQTSAGAYLAACPQTFHLILLDPPYRRGTVAAILPAAARVLAPGGVVLAETECGAQLPEACGALCLAKQYRYGTVLVSKYTLCAGDGQ